MTISVPPPRTGDLAGMLREALSELTDPLSLVSLTDGDLLTMTQRAEELGRIVDAARTFAAGEIADRSRPILGVEGLAARHGCRNAGELMERATLVAGSTARERIATAARVRPELSLTGELLPGPFPVVRDALADGALSLDAAAAISRALGPVLEHGADPDVVAAATTELLLAATGGAWGGPADTVSDADADVETDPDADAAEGAEADGCTAPAPADEVRIMAQTWALVLDPDGALPDEAKGLRRRELTLGRLRDGTVPLRGELLPEVAAQLQRLLDAYLNPRVDDAGAGPVFRVDGELTEDPEHRSSRQKRHDALAGILAVTAAHPDAPTLGGAAPTLVVAVTPDQLEGQGGVAFIQGADGDRAPVPATVAVHIGCAGAVQRVLQSTDGRILRLGVPQRIFTGHQRRAITVRDGECIIPGCHVPATWCEIHHVDEAARGGETHTDNGVLLCWFHHRTIDSGGWAIEMRGGVPWVRAPGWIDPRRRWQPVRSPLGRWQRQRN